MDFSRFQSSFMLSCVVMRPVRRPLQQLKQDLNGKEVVKTQRFTICFGIRAEGLIIDWTLAVVNGLAKGVWKVGDKKKTFKDDSWFFGF